MYGQRSAFRVVAAVAVVIGAFGWASPAGSQPATGTLEVVKVVEGEAPDDSFEITVDCDTDGIIPLTFDGPGTQSLQLEADTQDCEVVETDDLGAVSVTYDCEDVVAPVDPEDEGCQPPGPGGNFFQVFDVGQVVRITVTNTFEGGPDDTTTTTAPATTTTVPSAAAPATAVTATPSFTG